MHWIENALANVNLEALNDVLLWTVGLFDVFKLDIGESDSVFEKILHVDAFIHPIAVLAMFIVIAGAVLKLWITMMSPFGNAEEPGAIFVRTVGAGFGVYASLEAFKLAENGFNNVYQMFVKVYKDKSKGYTAKFVEKFTGSSSGASTATTQSSGKSYVPGVGWVSSPNQTQSSSSQGAFNLFGGESLIKGGAPTELGILILELIIGFALLLSFFRLVVEVYERYVLLGVMYITAPLAFASIISRESQIFKSWFQMVISQFILMCANLVFIGGFIGAWYDIMENASKNNYVFEDYSAYFKTMFILIGWLLIGQKLDQHLKGLGLATAQTGSGIMGALAGGAVIARTALGMAGSAAGTAGGGIRKAANGQLMEQSAWRNGTGIPGLIKGNGTGGIGNDINENSGKSGISAAGAALKTEPAGTMPSGKPQAINELDSKDAVSAAATNAAYASAIGDLSQKESVKDIAGPGVSEFDPGKAAVTSSGPIYDDNGKDIGSSATFSDPGSGIQATYGTNYSAMQKDYGNHAIPVQNSDGTVGGVVYSNVPGRGASETDIKRTVRETRQTSLSSNTSRATTQENSMQRSQNRSRRQAGRRASVSRQQKGTGRNKKK